MKFDASPRFLLPKFNSVQSIFLNFSPLLILQFSILCRIHLSFSTPPTKREREREISSRLLFLSNSLCVQSDCLPTKRKERNGPKRNQRKNNRHTYITITSGTGFIHTLSLFTLDLKEKKVHKKNDLSRFFGHAAARNRHGSQALTHVFSWGGRSCCCPSNEIATTRSRERRTRGTLWAPSKWYGYHITSSLI